MAKATLRSATPVAPAVLKAAGDRVRALDLLPSLSSRRAPLPFSLRVVLENLMRQQDGSAESRALFDGVAQWMPGDDPLSVPLRVDRVILPDSSGLPLLLDFAALRDALHRAGRPPDLAEPQIRCDLVVDHSLIVDELGHKGALAANLKMEFARNSERYKVFKWAQNAFSPARRTREWASSIRSISSTSPRHGARQVARHREFALGAIRRP